MLLFSRTTGQSRMINNRFRLSLGCLALMLGHALALSTSEAQVDNRRQEGAPFVRGVPSGSVYGDRRDARPGYRPGERVRPARRVDEVRPGYRPGAYGSSNSPCRTGGEGCARGSDR